MKQAILYAAELLLEEDSSCWSDTSVTDNVVFDYIYDNFYGGDEEEGWTEHVQEQSHWFLLLVAEASEDEGQ